MENDKNGGRPGFLPIETNLFDRIFMGTIISIAIHLLWMRFLEHWIPLRVANVICLFLIYGIAKWG
jgi:predicted small integral membrane protein